MKKYKIIIHYEEEYEGLDEEDAINNMFIDIENTPQQTLETFIHENTEAKELKK